MKTSARVDNTFRKHVVRVETDGAPRALTVLPRESGYGSSANGGELLCLALATCYCNDLYREARKRGLTLDRVEVEVVADFLTEGAAAERLVYRARASGKASREQILDLMRHTDTVAEIQNTIRAGRPVVLAEVDAIGQAGSGDA